MTGPRFLLSLVFLLLAPALLGASADLAVVSVVQGIPIHGLTHDIDVHVTNHGPDPAADVVITLNEFGTAVQSSDPRCRTTSSPLRCEISSLADDETTVLRVTMTPISNVGVYARLESTVTAATPDPNPGNNQYVLNYIAAYPPGEIRTNIAFAPAFGADGTLAIHYEITNQHGDFPAPLVAQIAIPEGTELVEANADCRATGGRGLNLECNLNVPPRTTFPLDMIFRTAEPSGYVSTTLKVTWVGFPGVVNQGTAANIYPRKFVVTSTEDSGAGSLREAISEANARCEMGVPCWIEFAIRETAEPGGWFRIRPFTPLPAIIAPNLVIDARTQTAFGGDTNPLGPEIFLDGSAVLSGSGFYLRGGSCGIFGFTISNFPENGIYGIPIDERFFSFSIHLNYIGTDPTGTRAMPNTRGIMIGAGYGVINHNVLSGNKYSGAFLWRLRSVGFDSNRIGVAAASEEPIPNGASGVFVGSGTQGWFGRMDFYRNLIANNGHFGIAYTQGVWAYIGPNRIEKNGLGAVDIDLDGPTPSFETMTVPHIDRAYWDGTGTVIEGTVPKRVLDSVSRSYGALLYANTELEPDGYAEGQQHFGTVEADAFGRFTLRYSGDLRGKYVNGMTVETQNFYGEFQQSRTSELGKAVLVSDGQ